MSFLLDTCVISEAIKDCRDAGVLTWVNTTPEGRILLPAIAIGELKYGIDRLARGTKRSRLETWFGELLETTASERILPLTKDVAMRWATLRLQQPNAKTADAQIAATALVHGLTLVTRNVRDFAFDGLTVFNPWSK